MTTRADIGSNLRVLPLYSAKRKVAELLKAPAKNLFSSGRMVILGKAGIPATNTAADAPSGLGDLCIDLNNSKVYRCTAYTSSSVFTWTAISA